MRIRRSGSDTRLGFLQELKKQRWDDHRLYHHSRINQSLHLLSAISFLTSYAILAFAPGMAAIVGWILAMCSRQTGHFFFEPDSFDEVNGVTNEHKEAIKVGYNIRRKVILLSIWAATPILLWLKPDLFGILEPHSNRAQYIDNLAVLWLGLGVAGLLVRTVQLFFIRNVQTGLVWATKILTDPFHDVKLYHRSPLYLLRGQLIDPMDDVRLVFAADSSADDLFEDDLEEPIAEN
jgi:hypothetical protein